MASIKIELYTHKTLSNGKHPIVMRIIQNRIRKMFSLGSFSANANEWDFKTQRANKKHQNYKHLNFYLDKKFNEANKILLDLEAEKQVLSLDEIFNKIKNKPINTTFVEYAEKIHTQLISLSKFGNAKAYNQAIIFFKKYSDKPNACFYEFDYALLKKLEFSFLSSGYTINGLSVYLRTLRAIYNRAIKEDIAKQEWYPFKQYSIKNEKTKKRAISRKDIETIKNIDLPVNSAVWHARNLFMFSFYTMGINYADLAHLKKCDVVGDRINYRRSKTHKDYSIKLTDKAFEILNYYDYEKKNKNDYIFPIIKRKGIENEMFDIQYKRKSFNKQLKKLATLCKINENLTSYVARHSWATVAKNLNVPIAVISEGLGHEDIKTTQIYLDEFDRSVIDKANEMITDI